MPATATTETMRRTASRNPGQGENIEPDIGREVAYTLFLSLTDDLDGTVVATTRSTEPPGDTASSASNAVTAYGRHWDWDEAAEDYISTTGKSSFVFFRSLPFRAPTKSLTLLQTMAAG